MSEVGCAQPAEDIRMEKELQDLFGKWQGMKGSLIPILQGAQEIYGYLPKEVLLIIARELKLPPSRVFGVVTFYAQFHLEPRGRNIVKVCLGTACHVRGGSKIYERMQEVLGVGDGETTEDLRYTLETVACLGCCGLSPVVMVNDDTHGRLEPEDLKSIVDQYE
ncbi:MAG: NADH-quinone oxidoreductase subunit NuoE [Syntrophaceticus sp.]|nr:NADH-quinone oxidoreductase subunit NuoE [Syntrophaceticus sp.]MDD4360069.1 NADH-quinone oxidoreductase subunit NuoE [Syntrophaceticus sp.]MDD4783342.1 NADH-quinone oxidoreductase subunit NuoE [Syntrophaceticus sp.]